MDETKFRGELALRTLAMPADTNANGDIFGGWLVSQMDSAAGISAKTYAKSRAATVAIEALKFKRPVSVGDIVCIYCDLYQVGTTSMKIHVEAWFRKPEVSQREKVTEGTFVFVAIDEEGRAKAIES